MQYRKLGNSGIEASVIGLGAWAIGGWMWGGSDDKDAIRTIHAGLDAGINLIDTAPMYGYGHSEEVVGRAIADRRERVVLATKCGLIWDEERGELRFRADEKIITSQGPIKVYKCLAPDKIKWEVEQSLRRLKTDHIDVLQTHRQESTTPIAETMGALMELKEEGKIGAIGCSNATPQQMEEYMAWGELSVDQELYSMLDRNAEESNLPFCRENNIAFFAYSPLAQGLLTGKVQPDREFPEGDQRHYKPRFSVENRKQVLDMLAELQPVADAHQISLAQLAIAWTKARPGCSHALVGARSEEQVRENAGAGEVMFSDDEIAMMQEIVDRHGHRID